MGDQIARRIQRDEPPANTWRRVLFTTLVLYAVGVVLLVLTGNPNLFPSVIMLGNFMVPATYVVYFYERRHLSKLTFAAVTIGFFYGGILGVFAAALLEPLLLHRLTLFSAFEIGLIEEFAKILGVLAIGQLRRYHSEMDGLILGAAAGMGFAAFESSGYAFTAFLRSGGSLSIAVAVTLFRGLLAPAGHGTWTAILASALFRDSRNGRVHITRRVVVAYLGVAILHGLWDGLPLLLAPFVSSGFDIFVGQLVVAAVSLWLLRRAWREARSLQMAQEIPLIVG